VGAVRDTVNESGAVVIEIPDGRSFVVPKEILQASPDGNWTAPFSFEAKDELVAAGAAEVPAAFRPKRSAANDDPEPVEPVEPQWKLTSEQISIERVPVNRLVEEPAENRQEGDTLIIPVVEEVLVLQKRILLREELRITKIRCAVKQPQPVPLERFTSGSDNGASVL
jgi:hypothetical protein